MSSRRLAALIALATVVADQVTKVWAVATVDGEPIRVIGDRFLRLVVSRNTGASFSSFQGGGMWIGLIVTGIIVFIVIAMSRSERRMETIALGFVLGGAVGNLIDRIVRADGFLDGAVIDWIDFSFFPSFNVADIAINVGVGLILLAAFLHREPKRDVS